ncbi:MAG TPA: serine/threonine-protein kinase [Chloroflexia bacterium]|nr:serine/threonine-protein kinase [Chloroflexia bacterium]
MLIKKLPGADGHNRPIDPQGSRPLDPGGSRALPSMEPGDALSGTSKLDALRQALGNAAILPRNSILQDRYEIEQVLGIGGMSTVYRARDLRFTNVLRYCAVKEMPDTAPDAKTGALRLANFEREASLLATLSHPGIPKIYDFFTHSGRVYLVLEHVDGRDLEVILEETAAPLGEDEVLGWAVQICDVLSYLHHHRPQPIVFRDLKPSNIMTDQGGEKVTLVDFGIAKAFQTDKKGTMIGTEGYSPPEQYRGLAEPRGDIYALGATLHHLLTNNDPRTETPFTFHERPVRQLNPLISPEAEALVMRALEYEAARRWESAEAMKAAILQILEAHQGGRPSELSLQAPAPPPAPYAPLPQAAPYGYAAAPVVQPGMMQPGMMPPGYPVQPGMMPPGYPMPYAGMMPGMAPPAVDATTKQLWAFSAEDEIRSSPAVHKGIVYIGCYDSNLYAINARTGEFVWKRSTEGGIPSSPAMWENLVIIGSEDRSVYALDAQKGTVVWTIPTGDPVRSSPRVADGQVFVGSDDQHLYCLDARTGRTHWKYRGWGAIRSSPVIGRGYVYVGCGDGNLYAVEIATGSMKWKFHSAAPITSSPALHEGLLYVGSSDQHLYALDVDTGWAVWKYRADHFVTSSPAVAGGKVFVGSVDGHMYAVEAQSGRLAWKYNTGSQVTSSPRPAAGMIYFGAVDHYVYCLVQMTGELRWRFATRGPVTSTPLVDEGVVYVGSLDHKLYALAV